MKIALQIRWKENSARQPTAWLIGGRSAAEWLEELTRWQVPLSDVRLLPITASDGGRTSGLLAVLADGAKPASAPCAIGYCCVGGRLLMPTTASFDPEMDEQELQSILPDDRCLYVWNPIVGLLRFGDESCLSVVDLLTAPRLQDSAWDAAVPGMVLNPRLISIALESLPSYEEMWNESGGDIGSETSELDKLPPSPNEPLGGPLGDIGRSMKQGIAKFAKWFAEHAPQTASKPTWVNKLGNWAAQQLEKVSSSVMAARNREIARLLNLLEANPDEGLKYALPLADAFRGLGDGGATLPPRDVNFSLKRLGGGSPASLWDLPYEYRQQLNARYRELANREIRLGRHRRAAYIFGELLGDFSAAAATLADGGHYQEAAVLYEERLNNLRFAAKCLERGGLWAEAIERYERLKDFEHIGQLYRRLEQPEKAAAAFRRAVEIRLAANDYCGAAELTENELAAPLEALEHLRAGWRTAVQSGRCFDEAFRLMARHAWHDRAIDCVTRLRDADGPRPQITILAPALAEVALSYPDAKVRSTAADITRVVVAEHLRTADLHESEILVFAVARLAPQDRLLTRDVRRFIEGKKSAARKYLPKSTRPQGSCREIKRFELPAAEWCAAVITDGVIVTAGWRESQLVTVRANWEGALHQPAQQPWKFNPGVAGSEILLVAVPDDKTRGSFSAFVHVAGQRPVPHTRFFPSQEQFPEGMLIGSHSGFSSTTLAAAYGAHGVLYTLDSGGGGELVVNAYSHDRSLLSTFNFNMWKIRPLDEAIAESDPSMNGPYSLLVRDEGIFVAFGKWLVCMSPDGSRTTHSTVGRVIRSLAGSPRHTRGRLVASLETGGMIQWTDHTDSRQIVFADDLAEPAVGLTRGGWLVAATRDRIEVYSTQSGKVTLHAHLDGPGAPPFAVLTGPYTDQFAVCTVSGKVQVFQVSNS